MTRSFGRGLRWFLMASACVILANAPVSAADEVATLEKIKEVAAGITNKTESAMVEQAALLQVRSVRQKKLNRALTNPMLTSPKIEALRAKEAELEQAIKAVRAEIIDAARELPEMKQMQEEIDALTARLEEVAQTLKDYESKKNEVKNGNTQSK